jgi:outer membrane protein assembly factor BamB
MSGNPDQGPHHATNPLGGPVHRRQGRSAMLRQWSGYIPLVRTCPACHTENPEANLYCTECATSLADIKPAPAEDTRTGLRHMQRRLAKEELARRRNRPQTERGGSGWLISGAVLLAIAVASQTGFWFTITIWIAGLSSAIWGLWQLRGDTGALRGWGIALAAAACGLIALVGSRSLVTSGNGDEPQLPALATPAASPAATPVVATTARGDFAPVAMLGADAAHTGQQPGPAPAGNPRLVWRFDAGSEVYGAPALADGVLYVTSKQGQLFAIDAATGQEVWRFNLSDYVVRSSPAVVDGVVYVGGGFNLFAVDAVTGKQLWKVPLRYAGQSAPTVANDIVVVASQEGWVYGINKDSGEAIWRSPADGLVFGAPAVAHDAVVFGTDAGNVYSLDIADGSVTWRGEIEGAVYAGASVVDDVIIVQSTSGRLVAMSFDTGDILWEGDIGGDHAVSILGNPGSGEGAAVVVTANDGGVYALTVHDGQQRWLHPSGKPQSGPAVTSGNTVVLGSGQNLIALNGTTGSPVWTYLAGDIISTAPTVSSGYVFFGAEDGFLYAVSDR